MPLQRPRLAAGSVPQALTWAEARLKQLVKQMQIPGAKAEEICKGFIGTVDSFFGGEKTQLSLFVVQVTVVNNGSCCVGAVGNPLFLPVPRHVGFASLGGVK